MSGDRPVNISIVVGSVLGAMIGFWAFNWPYMPIVLLGLAAVLMGCMGCIVGLVVGIAFRDLRDRRKEIVR